MIRADIARFKAALAAAGVEEGFMTAVAPASCARIANSYYKTDEEFLFACAEAMREEYKAIVDAGIILQLDDPCIAEGWDQVNPEPTVEDYRKLATRWIEALNHAIARPARGPHPLSFVLGQLARAACHRHPDARHRRGHAEGQCRRLFVRGRQCPPRARMEGVAGGQTAGRQDHPAGGCQPRDQRRRAPRTGRRPHPALCQLVGRERVIASTDCGLGGRVHPQIAWAKLEALAQGAALASKQLWR